MVTTPLRCVCLSVLLAFATSCAGPPSHRVPRKARVVGGGSDVTFTAPEPGIIYLYDLEKQRVIASALLGQGETLCVEGHTGKAYVVWAGPPETSTTFRATFEDLIVYFVPLRDLDLGTPGGGASAPQGAAKPAG